MLHFERIIINIFQDNTYVDRDKEKAAIRKLMNLYLGIRYLVYLCDLRK